MQILPSLQRSGTMLDMVDSCSMLFRLQMEGSASCPRPVLLSPVRSGSCNPGGPLQVPAAQLSSSPPPVTAGHLCPFFQLLPPLLVGASALHPGSPVVPTPCPPGLQSPGGTWPLSRWLLSRTRETSASQPPDNAVSGPCHPPLCSDLALAGYGSRGLAGFSRPLQCQRGLPYPRDSREPNLCHPGPGWVMLGSWGTVGLEAG